jgi:hypothetical protein
LYLPEARAELGKGARRPRSECPPGALLDSFVHVLLPHIDPHQRLGEGYVRDELRVELGGDVHRHLAVVLLDGGQHVLVHHLREVGGRVVVSVHLHVGENGARVGAALEPLTLRESVACPSLQVAESHQSEGLRLLGVGQHIRRHVVAPLVRAVVDERALARRDRLGAPAQRAEYELALGDRAARDVRVDEWEAFERGLGQVVLGGAPAVPQPEEADKVLGLGHFRKADVHHLARGRLVDSHPPAQVDQADG